MEGNESRGATPANRNKSPAYENGIGLTSELTDWPLQKVIEDNFSTRIWETTEAGLAVTAALAIDGAESLGLMIVGPSGAGKTTVLSFFEDVEYTYRTDEVTPAAFVSHDASSSEDQLEEVDLLPKIRHKTLLCRDFASWLSGAEDQIRDRFSTLAAVMDGRGYSRSTGVHGERGYTGDYTFNLLGATTPLKPRAWRVMGTVGNRLLFHQLPDEKSQDEIIEDIFGGKSYREKVSHVEGHVSAFLNSFFDDVGGYGSIEWSGPADEDVQRALYTLAEIIRRGRAPKDGEPEALNRILSQLRDIARGRAVLDGRTKIMASDLDVCARVALGSIPRKRRPVVRELLKADVDLEVGELESEMSRPTALKRMQELEQIGFGEFYEGDENTASFMILNKKLRWPDNVAFPSR